MGGHRRFNRGRGPGQSQSSRWMMKIGVMVAVVVVVGCFVEVWSELLVDVLREKNWIKLKQ